MNGCLHVNIFSNYESKLMTRSEKQQEFIEQFLYVLSLAKDLGSSNPTKLTEIFVCCLLGNDYKVNTDPHGADAFNITRQDANGVEIKVLYSDRIYAPYNGISVQPDLEILKEAVRKKIEGCAEHVYCRLDPEHGLPVELYKMSGEQVFNLMKEEKIDKQYHLKKNGAQKDPRISLSLCQGLIYKHAQNLNDLL
jgi:hypothetical protein